MSDTASPVQGETTAPATTDPPAATGDEKDWKAEFEKLQSQSRKWEQRAKDNASAATELEKFRTASMSEQEKAVEAARSEGMSEAARMFGSKLVAAELRAAFAGRDVDVDALLEGVDPTRFLGEDGEPDRKAIEAWVERLAPKVEEKPAVPGFPDLGQGVRSGDALALNGDPLLRDLKSKLGLS